MINLEYNRILSTRSFQQDSNCLKNDYSGHLTRNPLCLNLGVCSRVREYGGRTIPLFNGWLLVHTGSTNSLGRLQKHFKPPSLWNSTFCANVFVITAHEKNQWHPSQGRKSQSTSPLPSLPTEFELLLRPRQQCQASDKTRKKFLMVCTRKSFNLMMGTRMLAGGTFLEVPLKKVDWIMKGCHKQMFSLYSCLYK